MKQYSIALIALSCMACQAMDPRLAAGKQAQLNASAGPAHDADGAQLNQSAAQNAQRELSKAAQAHPKVMNLLLAINQHAYQEYKQTEAEIKSIPEQIKELPTNQELLQEIENLKEKQKLLAANPNAVVQEEINNIKQQIDDLGILLSVVGVISAVATHYTTADMHTSIKDSYLGKVGMRFLDQKASAYFYTSILEHPTIKQYVARRTVGNFTFQTSLANLLYGSVSGVKNQPFSFSDDYVATWASICLAEQIRTGIYFNKNSPRAIPGTDVIAVQDAQVVNSIVNGFANQVAQYPKESPSLSAFAQDSGSYLLHEMTYNAAVQLAYTMAQAQGIQPELIEAFLPKDCLARSPTQQAVKNAFDLLLPAALTSRNLDVLITTGLFAAQTATGDLNYMTLKLPGDITLLKDGQSVDACLETGTAFAKEYIKEYMQSTPDIQKEDIQGLQLCYDGSINNSGTSNVFALKSMSQNAAVNMATYMAYNLTSQLLHSIAEQSDLIDKELLESLFPKDLHTKTAGQIVTKAFYRKIILQQGIPLAAHAIPAAIEQIRLAQAACVNSAQLPEMHPRVLWALKHPVAVNGALLATQGITSDLNHIDPIKLPGTHKILITEGHIVDAGLKAGADVLTTKDKKFSTELAKNLATQVAYNGTTQLIHKVAQCSNINEKHVERFFPKDCRATTWTQRVTALLCRYGITQASTALATVVGAALTYDYSNVAV